MINLRKTRLGDLKQADAVFQYYTSYYSKRVSRRGGGAEIFILTCAISEPLTNLTVNLSHIEAVFVKVTSPYKTIIVSSIYRPSTNFNGFKTYTDNSLLSISQNEFDLIDCDAFNLDLIKIIKSYNKVCTFYNCMNFMDLVPTLCKPTRLTNSSYILIDKISLSNLQNLVSGIFTIGISDHYKFSLCIRIMSQLTDFPLGKLLTG